MLFLKKGGIVFALVQKRFAGFKAMTAPVQRALKRFSQNPLIIVFPEAARGNYPVARSTTKNWMRKIQLLLQKHGKAHVFFSVMEKAPLKKTLTNTGYLVGPFAKNPRADRPIHWQAYAKAQMPSYDENQLERFPNSDKSKAHWQRREQRTFFRFPRMRINKKWVELRVCADIESAVQKRSDVLVVPAWGLSLDYRWKQIALARALKKGGFAILNDVSAQGKFPRLVQRKSFEHLDIKRISRLMAPKPASRPPKPTRKPRPKHR